MSAPTYSEAELNAAIDALTDPERFASAEQALAASAPALQRLLTEVLAAGGWFEDTHLSAISEAAIIPEGEERLAAVRTLLAEESRITMMIGVAVGWALAAELEKSTDSKEKDR